MFNYFKRLNKKIFCSTCLLCMIGTSLLGAENNVPSFLGANSVSDGVAGQTVFLTNSLKDNIYSSNLLPIFRQLPVLYADADGQAGLAPYQIPKGEILRYGPGTNYTVYIAAMPKDVLANSYEDGSVNPYEDGFFDKLTWYVLDAFSWNKLCVKDPGIYLFCYHVKSTNKNIKGTIDDVNSLRIKFANEPVDMTANDSVAELGSDESATLSELDPNTVGLGFVFGVPGGAALTSTYRLSKRTFSEFLEQLINKDIELTGDVIQYRKGRHGRTVENGNMTIGTDLYSFIMLARDLANKNSDEEFVKQINTLAKKYRISKKNPNGKVHRESH